MAKWDWLLKPEKAYSWGFGIRVAIKTAILFIVLNVLFALINPIPAMSEVSLYNTILTGRDRLPYGENSSQSYNITVNNIPAMFASHQVSQPKADDEFRVLIMGDSSTWGWLLDNEDTLASQLNHANLMTGGGQRIVAYNLGYPILSLSKDLLLLDYAMRYEPDMIVWLVTLRSMRPDQQLFPPIVQNNADAMRELINEYDLTLDVDCDCFIEPDFIESTLVGQRRELANLLRLQFYGFSWQATGIDQYWDGFTSNRVDFDEEIDWQEYDSPTTLTIDDLAFDVLSAGVALAGDMPILIVNEPIFIADGDNSDLHYNGWYPQWVYDNYRDLLMESADDNNWDFADLWNVVPSEAFTDSPVHTSANGVAITTETLIPELMAIIESNLLD